MGFYQKGKYSSSKEFKAFIKKRARRLAKRVGEKNAYNKTLKIWKIDNGKV